MKVFSYFSPHIHIYLYSLLTFSLVSHALLCSSYLVPSGDRTTNLPHCSGETLWRPEAANPHRRMVQLMDHLIINKVTSRLVTWLGRDDAENQSLMDVDRAAQVDGDFYATHQKSWICGRLLLTLQKFPQSEHRKHQDKFYSIKH